MKFKVLLANWWSLSSEVGSSRNTKKIGSEGVMKYGYIVYGNLEPGWLTPTKDLKKEMERVKEEAEKKGFNMKYWGHPYGVSENIVVVYKSEKGLDAYSNLGINNPYTGARTDLVIIP